jgi:hypothetical protein
LMTVPIPITGRPKGTTLCAAALRPSRGSGRLVDALKDTPNPGVARPLPPKSPPAEAQGLAVGPIVAVAPAPTPTPAPAPGRRRAHLGDANREPACAHAPRTTLELLRAWPAWVDARLDSIDARPDQPSARPALPRAPLDHLSAWPALPRAPLDEPSAWPALTRAQPDEPSAWPALP